MISPGLFSVYQSSFSLFSCYETLQLKPRLPQFITGGTKAKAVDKARQTNSNQLPLNTHITPLSALLTYKWPIQGLHTPLIIYSSKSSRTNYTKNILDSQYKLNRLKILAFSLKRLNRQHTLHHQCNLTPLWFCIGSDLPNHETSLFSPTNRIAFSRCSHAEKEFGKPMRNGPPSPRIMRMQRSPSEKHQQTGNHSL